LFSLLGRLETNMAKVFGFLIVLTTLSLLLGFAGIQTSMGLLLDATGLVNNPESFQTSAFFNEFYNSTSGWLLLGALTATIVASFVTRQPVETFIIIGLAGTLAVYTMDFVAVLIYVKETYPNSWIQYIVSLIFIPLIVGYLISLISWWRNND